MKCLNNNINYFVSVSVDLAEHICSTNSGDTKNRAESQQIKVLVEHSVVITLNVLHI